MLEGVGEGVHDLPGARLGSRRWPPEMASSTYTSTGELQLAGQDANPQRAAHVEGAEALAAHGRARGTRSGAAAAAAAGREQRAGDRHRHTRSAARCRNSRRDMPPRFKLRSSSSMVSCASFLVVAGCSVGFVARTGRRPRPYPHYNAAVCSCNGTRRRVRIGVMNLVLYKAGIVGNIRAMCVQDPAPNVTGVVALSFPSLRAVPRRARARLRR